MFSYVDPTIHRMLVDRGALVTIGTRDRGAGEGEDRGSAINLLGPIPLPRTVDGTVCTIRWYPFVRRTEHDRVLQIAHDLQHQTDPRALAQLLTAQMTVNSLLVYGDVEGADTPLVRVHSCCMTGEVFGSRRCECGPQLDEAFRRIVAHGCGAVVYMASHEGRGIGLWAKGVTYLLQDEGRDTYSANRALGLPDDSRDFGDAAIVLHHMLSAPRRVRLMSNNPSKRAALERHGVEVAAVERLVVGVNEHNRGYMSAKRAHGHTIGALADEAGDDRD